MAAKSATASRKRPERTLWRVGKGCLQPYDAHTVSFLRGRKYAMGDVLTADLRKPRNPKFNAFAHALGKILADNLGPFEGLEGHAVLKRLQIEGNIGCDEIALNFPGVGPCSYRVPRSLSFESMDDGAFHEVIGAMCAYVARTYWKGCTAEQIEQMASVWVESP